MIRVLAFFLPVYAIYQNGLAATMGFGSMVPTNVVDKFMTSALQPVAVFIAVDLALGGGLVVAAWAVPFSSVSSRSIYGCAGSARRRG